MKRFPKMLLALVLVLSLSFPVPALAAFGPSSGVDQASHLTAAGAGGHAWYVATNGRDGEDVTGTIDDPFRTISYATSRMQGGDTVYVRGGTYRDEVTSVPSGTAEQPTTICAYENEKVWMTGGELIGGWTRTEKNPNIWVADMDWDMRDVSEPSELGRVSGDDYASRSSAIYYENLVFAGGNPAPEGRWPNATVDEFLDRERYAKTKSASATHIADPGLPDNVDFTGAQVWIASGGGYQTQMGTIKKHDVSGHRMDITGNAAGGSWMYAPQGGNYYFVTKGLATLDAAGEWYKDKAAGKLYLYEPNDVDPNDLEVEAQKRAHVIRVGYGKDEKGNVTFEPTSYVTISGINARLGSVAFSSATSHCTFERGTLDCPDHKLTSQAYGLATGILLSGTENLVTRCEIKHAYGSAVELRGTRNSFVNNYVHDAGYEHNEESAAIRILGSEHLVSHNTVCHVMRQALGGYFTACDICYNDLYDCMNVSRDGGVVYFNFFDYGNSEFHHNYLHGDADAPFDEMHVGLYLDSFTTSLVIYRNVVYGIQNYDPNDTKINNNGRHLTYQQNPNSLNNVYVNNTFLNYRPTHLNFYPNQDMSGSVFVNNIYQSLSFIDGPTYYPWNRTDIYDNAQRLGYSVSRDILMEMGAWFDSGHNWEGDFKNNTWPPIENQWTNPAAGDFTLAEGSEAIDAGVVVDGVTDGYVGAAPDLGAYEYGGEAWKPGCDLERDIADAYVLNTSIPYVNRLVERGFEHFTSEGGSVDFAEWQEIGSPQVSSERSAWTTWGWLVKQGSRCAVLANDGDALVQHVSGLKPNTAYRVGGYGFVAGRYVEPSAITGAKGTSGEMPAADVDNLRKKGIVSLEGMTELSFSGVNFGQGRNRICIGLRNPKVRDGADRQVISVALGNSGNVVGSYEMTKALSTAEISWRWATIELDRTYTGLQDVHLLLSGNFSGTSCAGFFPDGTASTDVLAITAIPSGAEAATANISNWYKPFEGDYYAPHSTVVRTGASGELDFNIAKRGSDMVAYVDEVFLSELPGGENFGGQEPCTHVFEADKCAPTWEWHAVDEYYVPDLTLTCSLCGERVVVQPPVTREEDATHERCSARFDVVGGVCESSDGQTIPYHSVTAEQVEHGTVTTSVSSAKRGQIVDVTASPDDGYALGRLSYKTTKGKLDRSNGSLIRTKSFSMPPDDVVVTSRFDPAFFMSSISDQMYTGEWIEPKPVMLFGDAKLAEGLDYTLTYEDNVEPGTAKVTATGMGTYEGSSASVTFEIKPSEASQDTEPDEETPKETDDDVRDGLNGDGPEDLADSETDDEKVDSDTNLDFNPSPYPYPYSDSDSDSDSDYPNPNPGEILPVHVHFWSVWNVTKAATCTEQGEERRVCLSDDSHVETRVLSALGHEWENFYTVDVAATPTKEGSKSIHCARCGERKGITKIPTLSRIDIGKAAVKLARTSYVHSGWPIKPAVESVTLDGVKLSRGTDYEVSYSRNVKVGTAKVTVTGVGDYTGGKSVTFKIVPKGTFLVKLTASKRGFAVKWKKQATQTTGYLVQYSSKSSFKSAHTVTVAKPKAVSKNVSKLKAKKKYWVRIRTYKVVSGKRYCSGWSRTESITTAR